MRALRAGISWSGLLSGPLAWAVSTQLNYALVDWQCRTRIPVIPVAALLLALFALAGGAVSWQAWREGGGAAAARQEGDTELFMAILGMLAAALFALIVIMQGVASFILDGCIR
jgi:hypothetical protein